MRAISTVFGLMFMGLLTLVFYDQIAGLATGGTATGTNQQAVLDVFPSAIMFFGIFGVAAFIMLGAAIVFGKKR